MCNFFFFNDTATTEIYTLSLHDALPISTDERRRGRATRAHDTQPGADDAVVRFPRVDGRGADARGDDGGRRSEEHTSELQSQSNLVCRLLLEKKKKTLVHHDMYIMSARV